MENNHDSDSKTEKYLAIFGWIVILFIPTIGQVEVTRYGLVETTFMWPWMFLISYTTIPEFSTDQINIIDFPWSFFIFIPFFYGLKILYELYHDQSERLNKVSMVILSAIIQIMLIFVSFASQEPDVEEDKTVFYIPELLIIVVFGYFAVNWYYEDIKASLEKPTKYE